MRNSYDSLMRRCGLFLSVALVFALSAPLLGQSPSVPSDRLGWTQSADASELALLTFVAVVDGQRQASPLAHNCVQTTASQADCEAPLPAMTPGTHTLELIAIRTEGGLVAESPKSAPLSIRIVVVTAPTDLRIIR